MSAQRRRGVGAHGKSTPPIFDPSLFDTAVSENRSNAETPNMPGGSAEQSSTRQPHSSAGTQPTDTPEPVSVVSAEDILAGLDEDQRRVVTELEGPMRVLAGAGTGKTRAITHRIAYGIATGRYVPQRVMALTFTTRAAEEMRLRLRALGAAGVQTRTFHSAALRQLRYFWPQAVGGTFPQIVGHKAPLITEAANRLRFTTDRALLRDIAAEIEWAKVSMLTADTLTHRLTERTLPEGITGQNMVRLFRTYEELKDERNVIDFEDILLLTVGIIEEDPALAATIRRQYRHFVVDEYQDVSPLQQRLLDAWLGGRDDVCVVGDASQTIYSFTGATSRHLLDFPHHYRGANTVRLTSDYRSHTQVVDLANRLLAARRPGKDSTGSSWAAPLRLESMRGPGAESKWVEYADDEQQAQGIAEDIRDMLNDGVPAREIAVLFRTNAQSAVIESALAAANIPYQLRGAEQFFDRPEVKQAILALRGSAKGTNGSENAAQLVRDVLSSLGYSEKAPASGGAVRQKWESLAALVSMVDGLQAERQAQIVEHPEQKHRPLSMRDVVAALAQRMATQDAPVMDGVSLASLHAAKGLEWDAVFLCGLNEGLVPISYAVTSDEIDEERRLLYVGITRARKYVTFTWSLSRTPGGRSNRKRSRFLDDIDPSRRRVLQPLEVIGGRSRGGYRG